MSEAEPPVPTRIGDYEIEGLLGSGGMAKVYRAKHAILETVHAIKVLDPEYRANAEARKRFLDEAKIQAKHLDHPNIVKVTNIVATAEHAALVMELIDGPSLESHLTALKGQSAEIKRIMQGVLDGVGHAHKTGIIHRDLKPANVLLARRGADLFPKVTDFGIAKVTVADDAKGGKKSTHAAARMGTLSYMSPEQIRRAKDVTARSDVFSLGAMLYEMATGEMAFGGDSDYDVMENIVNGRYEPAVRRFDKVDPVLAAVIAKALQSDPAARFASCEDMAAALRGEVAVATPASPEPAKAPAEALKAPPAPPPPAAEPPKPKPLPVATAPVAAPPHGSKKGLAVGMVVGALALGGGAVFLTMRKDNDTATTANARRDSGMGSANVIASESELPVMPSPLDPPPSEPSSQPVVEVGINANVPTDAAVTAVSSPPRPEAKTHNPCAGRWNSGEDLTINITGSDTTCGGSFAFSDTSASKGTCGARVTTCRIAGGKTKFDFACTYSNASFPPKPTDKLEGSMAVTCTGRSAVSLVTIKGGNRPWRLTKHRGGDNPYD